MNGPSAGELRHVVALRRPPAGLGTRGQTTGAATTLAAAWRAKIETLSGREQETAQTLYAGATLRVTMRHFPGLTNRDYLDFGGRILEIGHVDNVEQRDEWNVLLCGEDR